MQKPGMTRWPTTPSLMPKRPSTSLLQTESTFYPFDTKITAHNQLRALRQQSFKEKDGSTNNGFQQYITNFQNLSMKAGTKDEFNLISQFSLGLDQKLSKMILSMSLVPTTIKGWIDQSKNFHTQLVHI